MIRFRYLRIALMAKASEVSNEIQARRASECVREALFVAARECHGIVAASQNCDSQL